MGWQELIDLAEMQHGQIHWSQVPSAGLNTKTVRALARRQGWPRPQPGVVCLPGAPRGPHADVRAVLLSVGEPVFASHWTAAWLWGLVPRPPTTIEVLVAHHRRSVVRPNAVVHRTRLPLEGLVTEIDGLAVTSAELTIGCLAAHVVKGKLRAWAIDICQRGHGSWDELAALAAVLDRSPGSAKLRAVVEETAGANPESILDYKLRQRFRAAGLVPDSGPVKVVANGRSVSVDLPWSRWKVGVEADSTTYHGDRQSLQRDTQRHNALVPSDWMVFRATWAEVDDDERWHVLLRLVTDALRHRGAIP